MIDFNIGKCCNYMNSDFNYNDKNHFLTNVILSIWIFKAKCQKNKALSEGVEGCQFNWKLLVNHQPPALHFHRSFILATLK